jgi:hypothetical protein
MTTTEQPWLFGTMSRTEAEAQLQQLTVRVGAVLGVLAGVIIIVIAMAVGVYLWRNQRKIPKR